VNAVGMFQLHAQGQGHTVWLCTVVAATGASAVSAAVNCSSAAAAAAATAVTAAAAKCSAPLPGASASSAAVSSATVAAAKCSATLPSTRCCLHEATQLRWPQYNCRCCCRCR
jgi:hypothetical protein